MVTNSTFPTLNSTQAGLIPPQKDARIWGVALGPRHKSHLNTPAVGEGESQSVQADPGLESVQASGQVDREALNKGLADRSTCDLEVRRQESPEAEEVDARKTQELGEGERQSEAVGAKRKKQNPIKKKETRPSCVLVVDVLVEEVMAASETRLVSRVRGRKYTVDYLQDWVQTEWGKAPGKPAAIKVLDRG